MNQPSELARQLPSIVNAKPADLEAIDKTIADVEHSLAGLRALRKVYATRLGVAPVKKAARNASTTGSVLGDDEIVAYIREYGPAKPGVIADALGTSPQRIGKVVSSSPRLDKSNSGLVHVATVHQ